MADLCEGGNEPAGFLKAILSSKSNRGSGSKQCFRFSKDIIAAEVYLFLSQDLSAVLDRRQVEQLKPYFNRCQNGSDRYAGAATAFMTQINDGSTGLNIMNAREVSIGAQKMLLFILKAFLAIAIFLLTSWQQLKLLLKEAFTTSYRTHRTNRTDRKKTIFAIIVM
ncbi:hypothetical protein ANN_26482 [Periplaneta americana]|uniref:Uncharacterized protein n=1 Tax=Periplaneta americana TaxID=6978 RepID=A0ABQ8RYB1_PERAM|nr:hypothetical protein ANN_26482 [Periplaneta americana]